MKKIKIAHIAHSVGGVDVYVRLILDNIDNAKFSSIVIHGYNDTNKAFFDTDKANGRSYCSSIVREISPINDLKAILSIYKILKKEKPDLIHAHSAKGGIVGRVVGVLTGIKVIYTPHAFSYLSAHSKSKRMFFLFIERLFSKGNVELLATSKSEIDRAMQEVGYNESKACSINNSINPIQEIRELTIPRIWPQRYICTVGRPSYQKNIELMIQVLYEVNKSEKIHLVVMGVGPVSGQLESVKRTIELLGMGSNVTLLNWTERSDVFNIISKSEFYISTARYEGLPYSIIESLALSKPAIVTDCDGNRDLIQDDYNGFVIQNNDVFNYKNKILKLLNDKKLLDRFSKNAHQSFVENYNIQDNIFKVESLYIKHYKSL
jgi:glycosyltransferase involved in cell wall biosynthesis